MRTHDCARWHAVPTQYDLSGPRLGATFSPDGAVRSQFGWHFEHQIEAAERGPSLLAETVLLVGGVERPCLAAIQAGWRR